MVGFAGVNMGSGVSEGDGEDYGYEYTISRHYMMGTGIHTTFTASRQPRHHGIMSTGKRLHNLYEYIRMLRRWDVARDALRTWWYYSSKTLCNESSSLLTYP